MSVWIGTGSAVGAIIMGQHFWGVAPMSSDDPVVGETLWTNRLRTLIREEFPRKPRPESDVELTTAEIPDNK